MNIVTEMTEVFTEIMQWIITAITSVVGVFWNTETGLTFLGILAIVALGVSIFFLLMGLIQKFLHLRG